MKLADVVGQQIVKEKLSELITTDRLPHAMMILGPEGGGGLALALAIAQNLVCERRWGKKEEAGLFGGPSMFGDSAPAVHNRPLTDACGECPACRKAEKFIHPDIHFTYPVVTLKGKDNPPVSKDYITEWRQALAQGPYLRVVEWLRQITDENKQGNITVNECHEIIRNINLMAYEARYKVQIIWMAEYLREAGNTLLKIIEEPPGDTIFILVVENIELVLNTIISRTQLFKLTGIDDSDLAAYLQKMFEMDERTAMRVARISDGNLNAALDYAGGSEHQSDTMLRDWLSVCLRIKGNNGEHFPKLVQLIEDIAKSGRENQKVFLKYFLWFLRESNLIAHGLKSDKLDGAELEFAQKLATLLDADATERLNTLVNRLHYYVERNTNAKIQFFSASFKIASILRKEKPVLEEY